MQRLSLLRLTFETEINPWEVPAFQAAVADYLGGNPEGLFEPPGPAGVPATGNRPAPLFAYPLAQFKMRRNHTRWQPLLCKRLSNPILPRRAGCPIFAVKGKI